MAPEADVEELLLFFKALADPNRLRIVGLLASQPHTVEELAAILHLGAPTVSHHLSRLAKARLVDARAEGYYSSYRLRHEQLSTMAKRMLKKDELPQLASDLDLSSYDKKVLSAFLSKDGRIKAFPMQEKKLHVITRYVLSSFEVGRRYTEKEVNHILKRYSDDTALLRRALVDYGYMEREGGGGLYWRSYGRDGKE
ncbi:MAG TPA: metalloregulator ArsR/SmtB family transcription factor [Bacteroidota bacterium]|nr:metalloregulator ArsR/SmtB family transcription factor [Bacteroidota bacterium]